MSTGLIVAIVVVVVLLVILFAAVLPRARRRARLRAQERELNQRRDAAIGEHRGEAQARTERAELSERRARIAEQEAARDRAEARLHEERAELHERGLADHELRADDGDDAEAADYPGPSGNGAAVADPEQDRVGARRPVGDDTYDEVPTREER